MLLTEYTDGVNTSFISPQDCEMMYSGWVVLETQEKLLMADLLKLPLGTATYQLANGSSIKVVVHPVTITLSCTTIDGEPMILDEFLKQLKSNTSRVKRAARNI